MKNSIFILFCSISFSIYGQEVQPAFDGHNWKAPYRLAIPKDWTIERFLIPISFAPQIPYKGVEDIRFAPGWANQQSEEYWTYAFLWYLEGRPKTSEQIIAENLKNYYTGLLQVNTDSATAAREKPFPVKTAFKQMETASGDLATYYGTIEMRDYMKRTPIVLHAQVHLKYCEEEKRTIIFHELSPKPFTHNNWEKFEQLWSDFNCKTH